MLAPTRIKRGEQVVFWDEISPRLEKLNADAGVVSRVIGAVSLAYKTGAREENARTFQTHTGKYLKSINYKMARKSKRSVLYAGQLSSIFEKKGAEIFGEGKTLSNFSTYQSKGVPLFVSRDYLIDIPARPWFYDAVRRMRDNGIADRAANQQLAWEILGNGL